jgi:hypothetical protein
MDADQNNADKERFEESLRQILSHDPSDARAPRPRARQADDDGATRKTAEKMTEAERKTLFWFKLTRLLAFAALLTLLTLFILRITTTGR